MASTQQGIQSQAIPPPKSLEPYINAFLRTSIHANAGAQDVDLFPVGHAVMSFALDNHPVELDGLHPVRSKWNLTGQLQKHHRIRVGGAYSYVYVLFKPAGAYRFFGGDLSCIEDHFTAVQDWLPDEQTAASLRDMSGAGMDARTVLRMLQEWLLARLSAVKEDDAYGLAVAACTLIDKEHGRLPVAALCERLYVSQTKLERCFRRVVGTSPKRYSRILRFNRAYAVIQSGAYSSWAEVVHNYSYFDQAHFIREFKGFCGYTPASLYKSAMNIAGHVVEHRA